jgi:hypothetical protein
MSESQRSVYFYTIKFLAYFGFIQTLLSGLKTAALLNRGIPVFVLGLTTAIASECPAVQAKEWRL